MEIRKVLALRGPNVWANVPVVEAKVDLEGLKGLPPDALDRLPGLAGRGGLGEGGELLARVALGLQVAAGSAVGYYEASEAPEDGTGTVVVEYEEEAVGRAALVAALRILGGAGADVEAEVEALRDLFHEVGLGPSTKSIVRAAEARGVPARRINEGSLVRLGHGARSRRILAAETDRTGAIAEAIAKDKELTRALLLEAGVPVPRGRAVADADDAWEAAREVGLPVVVKPQYGNQGRGVATNLSTEGQVRVGYATAREEGDEVVVERFLPGGDYRVLVVGGRVVAASKREPARVVGDGRTTVAGLVEEVNRDPRRDGHATALSRIALDGVALAVLAEQGYAPGSVPPAGATVLIRRNANLSTGGTAADVTDAVHPEVAARSVEAARVVGLDVAGIDVVAEDIGRPLEEQGGGVVEVNAGPGLRMHLEPSTGTPRAVGDAIVATMFPDGETGRIPIAAVTGVNGKTTVTRLIAHVLRASGRSVGMTCTDGVYIDGRRIEAGDCSGPASARMVLANLSVEAAVLETARGGILRAGLGFDRCDVAVVTNIGEGDHLGLGGVRTPADLARVKRTPVRAVAPGGWAVLNADDPLVAAMAGDCPGGVIYFGRDDPRGVIAEHRASGGRAVFARDGEVVLAEGDRETRLVAIDGVPMTLGGRIGFQVENVLAAAAAAWALGLSPGTIRDGLTTFSADEAQAPGRFNVLEARGGTVVVDYGHNSSAVAALIEAVGAFPQARRSVAFTAMGDRRDEDVTRQAGLLGDAFDRVIFYESNEARGRAPGEVVRLLLSGLSPGRRACEVLQARNEAEAVSLALAEIGPDDLVLIQVDETPEITLERVRDYLARGDGDGVLTAPGVRSAAR